MHMGELRDLVFARSGGFCEITGHALGHRWELHHRRPKGMGGTRRVDTDTAENCVAITPTIHNGSPDSVHQRQAWSRPRGYLLRKDAVPALEPMLYRDGRWVLLLPGGGLFDLGSAAVAGALNP